jgi:hypothetical protein
MFGYFWFLVKRSFHGTLRTLEIGEAIVAIAVHVFGYFFPAHKETLEVLFVVLVALLVLTFFFGLFLAAYASNQEDAANRIKQQKEYSGKETAWAKERDELYARLKAKGLTTERTQEVHDRLSQCSPEEQDIIRLVARSGHMHKEKIAEYANSKGYSYRNLEKLSIDTGLLLRDVGTDFYRIPPIYEVILADYFFGSTRKDN